MDQIKILFIGDLVGRPGRSATKKLLPKLREEYNIDYVIANAENAAGGFGLTEKVYHELTDEIGIDMLTSGNHIWDKKELLKQIDNYERIVRPYNYPQKTPGVGYRVVELSCGIKVATLNILCCVFMGSPFPNPFLTIQETVAEIKKETDTIFVDIHGEATSEKKAMALYLDGKVSAVVGTHTHVQTADERLLHNKTAFISDVGMTGAYESTIGVNSSEVLERFLTNRNIKFKIPTSGPKQLNAVVVTINPNGQAENIERISEVIE